MALQIVHFRTESPEHYFLDCFLYSPERQTLFSLIEHYVPYFNRLTKKKKLDLILRGVNIDDEVFLKTNTTLTKAVQNFIIKTNRFSEIEIKTNLQPSIPNPQFPTLIYIQVVHTNIYLSYLYIFSTTLHYL